MRSRFFAFIFFFLLVVTTVALFVQESLLRSERLKFIDQQVRETATALFNSELNGLREINFEQIEDIISEELGETRIGKFFIIRDASGAKIFESTSAQLLPLSDVPDEPQWITINKSSQFIRVLNLKLPRIDNRTLQVGVLFDSTLIHGSIFSSRNGIFFLALFVVGLLVSWLLTSTLMLPIKELADQAVEISKLAENSKKIPFLTKRKKRFRLKNDEFSQLEKGLDILIDRVNRGYELTRQWTHHIAHELKTPLTLISNAIEAGEKKGGIPNDLASSIRGEVFGASEIISSFLVWAETEGSDSNRTTHVLTVSRTIHEVVERLTQGIDRSRIEVECLNDFKIVTEKTYFDLMLVNLLQNALKHSPKESLVTITISNPTVEIVNTGEGLSESVLQKLGSPFNRGESFNGLSPKGHGLGLAIVLSISRRLGIDLTFGQPLEGRVSARLALKTDLIL